LLLPIHSPDDPRVADYRAIPEPDLLRTRGLFVAEGRLVVRRLLASQRFRARSLLVNASALDSLRDVFDAEASPLDVFVGATETLVEIAGFNFHRGCLALGERPSGATLEGLALDSGPGVVLLLQALAQADNVGSVFRNAAAFGVRAVLLDAHCCEPLYRKAMRTSMAAVLDVPFARLTDSVADLVSLRAMGYRIVALTPAADARPIDQFVNASTPARLVLLVGNEGVGLSPALEALADDRVTIAITKGMDSLNVATATGIALHRLSGISRLRESSRCS
jgi:tRNA G18 (ribose-2'-O)-methylase SpoU